MCISFRLKTHNISQFHHDFWDKLDNYSSSTRLELEIKNVLFEFDFIHELSIFDLSHYNSHLNKSYKWTWEFIEFICQI
jgi:hypothetical protein